MEDHNRFVYVCSYSRYACVVERDGSPPGSVKKIIYCSKKHAMRERETLLLGSYRSYCLFSIQQSF